MRSIRRSLLGYFLVLLAVALGLIAALVDSYAVEAIQASERAESDRTAEAFKARRLEAQAKFDAELVQEARSLSGELLRAWVRNIAQRGGRTRRDGQGTAGTRSQTAASGSIRPLRSIGRLARRTSNRVGMTSASPTGSTPPCSTPC